MNELVAELRRSFDEGFARAPEARDRDDEELLGIAVGDAAYAVRIAELAGVVADRSIVPLPSPIAPLLGLVGYRGTLLPVYDLGQYLGHAPAESPRWIALVRGEPAIGFAFGRLDGNFRCRREELRTANEGPNAQQAVVLGCGRMRAVVGVEALRASIVANAERLLAQR